MTRTTTTITMMTTLIILLHVQPLISQMYVNESPVFDFFYITKHTSSVCVD